MGWNFHKIAQAKLSDLQKTTAPSVRFCLALQQATQEIRDFSVIESFNGKMRDECLNLEWFIDLHHARDIIENWRHDYNTFRLHSSLNNLTPAK